LMKADGTVYRLPDRNNLFPFSLDPKKAEP
jgi:hypothetical protein